VSLRGTREVKNNYQLFRLTGLLDAFSEPTFRKTLDKCIDEGPNHIILDLSKIEFLDSSGLGALVQLVKKAQSDPLKGTLQVVSNARVTQTVKLVRLEKFLSLQPSVEAALANIEGWEVGSLEWRVRSEESRVKSWGLEVSSEQLKAQDENTASGTSQNPKLQTPNSQTPNSQTPLDVEIYEFCPVLTNVGRLRRLKAKIF
jgi:anti-anti-sigma factor